MKVSSAVKILNGQVFTRNGNTWESSTHGFHIATKDGKAALFICITPLDDKSKGASNGCDAKKFVYTLKELRQVLK